MENGFIESFNGRLRDECLKVEVFFTLEDAREKLERWQQDYNQARPHSALGDRAPVLFLTAWSESASRAAVPIAGDTQLSTIRPETAQKSAQTTTRGRDPQLPAGTVLRGGSVGICTVQIRHSFNLKVCLT